MKFFSDCFAADQCLAVAQGRPHLMYVFRSSDSKIAFLDYLGSKIRLRVTCTPDSWRRIGEPLFCFRLVKYVVSQNCDGLHIRSGLSRSCLSELHGNMYMEMCTVCEPNTEYFRYFDLTKKTRWRRHQTGRKCHECGSPLNDTIVLFGEKSRTEAPMFWESAAAHAAAADVVICLGTSLTVRRTGNR